MINIIHEPENQRAAAYDGEKNIGEATYSKSDKIWIIDHTFVDKSYGGQGIAAKLVDEVVRQARANNVKINPLCPYAKRLFEKTKEYADIWV